MCGLSRATLYRLLNDGKLTTIKVGARRLVPSRRSTPSWTGARNDDKTKPRAACRRRRATSEEQRAPNSTKSDKSEDSSARLQRSTRPRPRRQPIDFAAVNKAALTAFPAVLARILPGGKRVGAEFVALNPRRADRHLGSFKVNRGTGRWSDFATGDTGGDPISLVAYVADVSQGEAARLLARMLGLEVERRRDG